MIELSRLKAISSIDLNNLRAEVEVGVTNLEIQNALGPLGYLYAPDLIAFLTDSAVVDKIIDNLKLTFVAERPPPPHIAYQEVLMTAELSAEYFS